MSSFCLDSNLAGPLISLPNNSFAASRKTYSAKPPESPLPSTAQMRGRPSGRPACNLWSKTSVRVSLSREMAGIPLKAAIPSSGTNGCGDASASAEEAAGEEDARNMSSRSSVAVRTVSTSRMPSSISNVGLDASILRSKHGCTETWYTSPTVKGLHPSADEPSPTSTDRDHQALSAAKSGLRDRHQRCRRRWLCASRSTVFTRRP
mmetsp:Transcript_45561/g.114829  ORF Transcript_45561/g.114829 Transcript_45561/m.114829 type:complete len:206 (+) Transcript_45561:795-1412(+)